MILLVSVALAFVGLLFVVSATTASVLLSALCALGIVALLIRRMANSPVGAVLRDLRFSVVRSVDMGPVRGGLLPRLWFGLLAFTILITPFGGF